MLRFKMIWLVLLLFGTLSGGEIFFRSGEKLTPLTHTGHVELSSCYVEEMCKVTGSLNAYHTLFDQLIVNGDCILKECVIGEEAKVRGRLFAKRSVFKGPLELIAQHSDFQTVILQDVQVSPYSKEGEQIVTLSHGSHVNGNIQFASKKGVVYLYSDSRLEGAVIGGRLVRAGESPTSQ